MCIELDPKMNDPIMRSVDDKLYKKIDGKNYIFKKDLLRIYDWELFSGTIPENCTNTTLTDEKFIFIENGYSKDKHHDISTTETGWIVNETGGFTAANNTNDFINYTHQAVRSFNEWIPENAQQRRFKSMVENLEQKAKIEEENHVFKQGKAMPDFNNP